MLRQALARTAPAEPLRAQLETLKVSESNDDVFSTTIQPPYILLTMSLFAQVSQLRKRAAAAGVDPAALEVTHGSSPLGYRVSSRIPPYSRPQ
jgi:hypothetical protein